MLPGLRLIHSRDSVEVRGGSRRTVPPIQRLRRNSPPSGAAVFRARRGSSPMTRRSSACSRQHPRSNTTRSCCSSRSTICCCAASVPISPRSIRTLRRTRTIGDVAPVFRSFVSNHADQIRELVATRKTQTNEVASLLAVPPAARPGLRRVRPTGCRRGRSQRRAQSALSALLVRVRTWRIRWRRVVGSADLRDTRRPADTQAIPVTATSVGLDLSPIDVHDADQTRWLEACVWPDQPDRFARLRACLEIARKHPPDCGAG